MCLAYGARDASVEEDAFRKGRCDERRVLEAAFRRSNRIAGVRDKPLGGIVECGAGAEERVPPPLPLPESASWTVLARISDVLLP